MGLFSWLFGKPEDKEKQQVEKRLAASETLLETAKQSMLSFAKSIDDQQTQITILQRFVAESRHAAEQAIKAGDEAKAQSILIGIAPKEAELLRREKRWSEIQIAYGKQSAEFWQQHYILKELRESLQQSTARQEFASISQQLEFIQSSVSETSQSLSAKVAAIDFVAADPNEEYAKAAAAADAQRKIAEIKSNMSS